MTKNTRKNKFLQETIDNLCQARVIGQTVKVTGQQSWYYLTVQDHMKNISNKNIVRVYVSQSKC